MRGLIRCGLYRPQPCHTQFKTLLGSRAPFARSLLARDLSSTARATRSRSRRQWPSLVVTFAAGFGIVSAYRILYGDALDELNPETFTPFRLTARESVSPTSSIFTLSPSSSSSASSSFSSSAQEGAGAGLYTEETQDPFAPLWNTGVWSVEFKQPQLQIARSYTPLPPSLVSEETSSENLDNGPGHEEGNGHGHANEENLRFLIRREKKGEVSNYLHRIGRGTCIDVRGPQLEYAVPSDTEHIVFIAGGTGIAPALQVARALFSRRTRDPESDPGADPDANSTRPPLPKIHILWANRKREDVVGGISDTKPSSSSGSWNLIPWRQSTGQTRPTETVESSLNKSYLVKELDALKKKYPSQVKVDYFVDEEGTFVDAQKVGAAVAPAPAPAPALASIGPARSADTTESSNTFTTAEKKKKRLILVSGPEGFVDALAGPKVWANGREVQGPLAGLLSRLPISDWTVWKL